MNTFNFDMRDWELVRVNKASVTLRSKQTGKEIYATKKVINAVLANNDNICMLVEKHTPETACNGPVVFTWLATMLTL